MYSPSRSDPYTSGEPPTRPPDNHYRRRLPNNNSYSATQQEPDSGYEASPATPTTDQHFFGPHDTDDVFEPPSASDCDSCHCGRRQQRWSNCDSNNAMPSSSSARPASLPIGIPRPPVNSRLCSCSSTSPFQAPLAALAAQPRSWPSSMFSWMRRCSPSEIVRMHHRPLPEARCPVHGGSDDLPRTRQGQSSSTAGIHHPQQGPRRRHRTLNDCDLDSLSSTSGDSDDFSMLSLHEDEAPRAEPLPDLVLHSSPRRNRSVSVSLPIGDDPYVVIGRSLRRLSDQFEADRLPPSYRRQTMDNGVFRRSP